MKAKSHRGQVAQDYTTDKVGSFDDLYTGKRDPGGVRRASLITEFYEDDGRVHSKRTASSQIHAPERERELHPAQRLGKSVLATLPDRRQ